ncbi:hypothetical protein PFI31113_00561 [Pandoraea fibrosis]|uniref:Uncharacterized protein n=1 Tax=Pandoraea fibrosis TaxID=1891094 RepID=A0A5E4S4K0_9BURK|nr:hypothetical protein PFI31113_00561 [Pandoraea fibrosis]
MPLSLVCHADMVGVLPRAMIDILVDLARTERQSAFAAA